MDAKFGDWIIRVLSAFSSGRRAKLYCCSIGAPHVRWQRQFSAHSVQPERSPFVSSRLKKNGRRFAPPVKNRLWKLQLAFASAEHSADAFKSCKRDSEQSNGRAAIRKSWRERRHRNYIAINDTVSSRGKLSPSVSMIRANDVCPGRIPILGIIPFKKLNPTVSPLDWIRSTLLGASAVPFT